MQPPAHSTAQVPLLQVTVLPAPTVSAQVELEQATVAFAPVVRVQVALLHATVAPAPSCPVQVELEQPSWPASAVDTAQPVVLLQATMQSLPHCWVQVPLELQLRLQTPSQRWAHVPAALQLHALPASVAAQAQEPPSHETAVGGAGGGLQAAARSSRQVRRMRQSSLRGQIGKEVQPGPTNSGAAIDVPCISIPATAAKRIRRSRVRTRPGASRSAASL